MSARIFEGEREIAGIDPGNRGLAYGDGLFETMRVHRGAAPLWPRHLARLREGAERLGIALPATGFVEARIAETAAGCDAGVAKLLLARGGGGRGYAPEADAQPVWMLSLHPLPPPQPAGLRLHWCETRLALQPALAGIKHCNRLEQVLARAEAARAGCDEGLVLDCEEHVVGATSANLLLFRDGRWWTPFAPLSGVAGVLRGWLLEQGLAEYALVDKAQAESVEALALCNAVRGILPVASLGAREWRPHAAVADLQERLAMAYPMFSTAKEGA